jgi:hypothetical protein
VSVRCTECGEGRVGVQAKGIVVEGASVLVVHKCELGK